ncbi:MAG: enoyl-CoA hydratase/isomerase family protein [Bradyrhizobiaceae bacterium]|nr:enoyl-CoA hydratase/isomerase family protein [Bradyrhizobiaceae bacterium]
MAGRVYSSKEGSIATVVLEHPGRLNALSLPMWQQLKDEFQALSADEALRCVVVRGAGNAFAAGADIAEFENERYDVASAKVYGKVVHGALEAISTCVHPVIALIQGPCVGGGLEIVARCDLRICGEGARFGIPVNRLGAVVAYEEMLPLIQIAGPAAVLEILLEGRIINAAEAERARIVNRVVADAGVEQDVYATAARIAAGAPLVARWHKKFVRRLLDPAPLSAAELEDNFACFATEDFQTGFRSFLDKKKPVFKGR